MTATLASAMAPAIPVSAAAAAVRTSALRTTLTYAVSASAGAAMFRYMVLIYDIVGNRYKKGFNANLLRRQAMGLDFLVQSASKFEYNQSAQMDS